MAELGHEPARGPWPADPTPTDSFTIPYDMHTWDPLPTVHVALVPTREGGRSRHSSVTAAGTPARLRRSMSA